MGHRHRHGRSLPVPPDEDLLKLTNDLALRTLVVHASVRVQYPQTARESTYTASFVNRERMIVEVPRMCPFDVRHYDTTLAIISGFAPAARISLSVFNVTDPSANRFASTRVNPARRAE